MKEFKGRMYRKGRSQETRYSPKPPGEALRSESSGTPQ
jgi:hypothetical protein